MDTLAFKCVTAVPLLIHISWPGTHDEPMTRMPMQAPRMLRDEVTKTDSGASSCQSTV